MATRNDKFSIHPGYACGHDWNEFIEALEKAGLEKDESPFGWSQILHPRTTLWRSKDEGPYDIVTVELTHIGQSIFGPFKDHRRFIKTECSRCGRAMVADDGVCRYCKRDAQRRQSATRSRLYRRRHGIVKDRFLDTCPVCGKEFRPKRSTARFCSTTCRVKAHRDNIRTR